MIWNRRKWWVGAVLVLAALPLRAEKQRLWLLLNDEPDSALVAVRAAAARTLGWVPGHGYLLDLSATRGRQLAEVRRHWRLKPWRPPQAQIQMLRRAVADRGQLAVSVHGLAGTPAEELAGTLERLLPGGRVASHHDHPQRPRVELMVDPSTLSGLLDLWQGNQDILWIEPTSVLRFLNTDSVEPLQANMVSGSVPPVLTPIWNQGLIGSGQIVAVADTGVDRNEGWFISLDQGSGPQVGVADAESTQPPLPGSLDANRKVVGYWVMPGAQPYDNDGHGTHVAGSVAGDRGTPSTPTQPNYNSGDGMAPNAQLLVQDIGVGNNLSGQGGAPMWLQALNAGAHVHSNSYGASPLDLPEDAYTGGDAELDDFLWREPGMLVLFAAGNDNADNTINHPGAAKNATTVGALGHGGSLALMNLSPGFGSSRGPTVDGRIKPDVMAPGTSICSAAENAANDNNGPAASAISNCGYSGTSMATPTVAGMATLARQYLVEGFYPTGSRQSVDAVRPSGVLLKALLINGAENASYPDTPSFASGWGRVWLDNSLYFDGDPRGLRFYDVPHHAGLAQGESVDYIIQAGAAEELRVTLAWYDPAPAPGGDVLVNDLDLQVIGPSGTFLGNRFAAGESETGGSPDTLNPVEGVIVRNPQAGDYTIRVTGSAVPGNGESGSERQGFALVASAQACTTSVIDAPAVVASSDASGVSLSFDPIAGATRYEVYRADGDCAAPAADFQWLKNSDALTVLDTRTQGGFGYAYRVRAADACGLGPPSNCVAEVSLAPCTLSPSFDAQAQLTAAGDLCSAQVQWQPGALSCPNASDLSYRVFRSTDPLFDVSTATPLTTGVTLTRFQDYQVPAGRTAYYRVQAEDDYGNRSPASDLLVYPAFSTDRQPATEFRDGGENLADLSDLAVMGLDSPWRLTDAAMASGALSYHNGPDMQGYPNNSCAAVTTPIIDLQAGAPQLSYRARYALESDFDGVVVEISTDDGASWADLPPTAGYPGDFSRTGAQPGNACGYPTSQGAFNGSSGGVFESHGADLSAFAGQSVRLRWRFSSDAFVSLEGFYLDDVIVTQSSRPLACLSDEILFRDGFE